MNVMFRFANPVLLAVMCIFLVLVVCARLVFYRGAVYRYSLADTIRTAGMATAHPYKKILWLMRLCALALLVFFAGRPQLVDVHSKVSVHGIDIMLVLDLSGSMQQPDHDGERSRFAVAQEEALRFVEMRPNDAIGLVFFGKEAFSRCPLTLDKRILENILKDARIGMVDPDGTMLVRAMVCGVNRLKKSVGQSKVMIVLTDGEPSPQDLAPSAVVALCKQLGIRIYTMGIGSENDIVRTDPFWGQVVCQKGVNVALLNDLANQTGGQFFMAHNADEMRQAYNTIDKLETVVHEEPIFTHYQDLSFPWVWLIIILLGLELLLRATCWFGI